MTCNVCCRNQLVLTPALKMTSFFHGSRTDPRVGSGGSKNLAGRVGSCQEVFEIARVGSGGLQISRDGSGHPGTDPTRDRWRDPGKSLKNNHVLVVRLPSPH